MNTTAFRILIFIITLSVYIVSSPPVISTGDSGEFMTGAAVLGISHPPGFPVYTIVTRLFYSIPVANPGWRMEFGSMFTAAVAAMFLFSLMLLATKNAAASFIGAAAYAFAPTVWSQAVIAETYSLNALFVALLLFLILLFIERKQAVWLYLAGLVFGLSLANHYPLMLLAAPAFIVLIYSNRGLLRRRDVFITLSLCLPGLLLYLYLPIRARMNPPLNWGDPSNLHSFIAAILRKQYTSVELAQQVSAAEKIAYFKHFLGELARQFGVFLLPAVVGIVVSVSRQRKLFMALLLLFVTNSVFLLYILHFSFDPERIGIVTVYYLPSYVAFSVWVAIGLSTIFDIARSRGAAVYSASAVFAAALVAFNAVNAWNANYNRNNFLACDYANNVLRAADRNSVIFITQAGDESLFPVLFAQSVMRRRTDLRLYDCYGNVFYNIYGDGFNLVNDKATWLARRNAVEGRIIRSTSLPVYYLVFSPENSGVPYPLTRCGLLYRAGAAAAADMWPLYNMRGTHERAYNDYQEREIVGVYHYFMAHDALGRGGIAQAVPYFEKASHAAYDVNWLINNTALAYYRHGLYDEARIKFTTLLAAYPRYLAGWYNLGLVHKALNNPKEAKHCFNKCLEIAPHDKDTLHEIELLKKI